MKTQTQIKFDLAREERAKIDAAVDRVVTQLHLSGEERLNLAMSLTACHLNGCPLDLDAFQTARFADVLHDVAGIDRHIDHTTGKLQNCFWPRLARKSEGGAR